MKDFFESLPLLPENDPITMGVYRGLLIAAPSSFWNATQQRVDEVTGGCGPGSVGNYFVPDNIIFLRIGVACIIHDWCFLVWNTKEGFILANNIFKNNLIRIIEQKNKTRWLKKYRLRISRGYYLTVKHFGEPSYFDSHLKYLT